MRGLAKLGWLSKNLQKVVVLVLLTGLITVSTAWLSPPPAPFAEVGTDWCGGHGVPESKCTICNPELIARYKEAGDWCEGHSLPESVCPKCNNTATEATADWCGGHGVPESKCTICNPELIPKFKEAGDWCAGHNLPESVCPKCNHGPAKAAADKDWCGGHGVPESKCTICNPELISKFKEAGDWCAGHNLPESVCPKCNHGPAKAAADKDWCGGHGVPESKCTICNPELIPQFKEAGDWCAGHNLPESVCPKCNHGPTETTAAKDWCAGHGVPESKCTICNPELISKFKEAGDWCAGHNLPESVCPKCNHQPAEAAPAEATPANDWCAGHGVPESKCTICNPELIPKFKEAGDWCAGHNLPESVCPKCNHGPAEAAPAAAAGDWCGGHGVPESKCTICNPELIPQFKEAGDWCEEHQLPESVCPTCNPQPLTPQSIEARVVRFITPELEARAGIETEQIQQGASARSIQCGARMAFHGDRVADLRAIIPGVVRKIHMQVGDQVRANQPIFELESARIGEIQAHLRTAREQVRLGEINLKREQELWKKQITSAWDLELAKKELETARAEMVEGQSILRMAGADEADSSGRLTITAPISGALVRRPAVMGTLATDETSLGMIVDTSVMWALCEVPEQEAGRLARGDEVVITTGDGREYPGTLTWISAEVDPRSRTVTARAEVKNPEGGLRANQYAQARISTGASGQLLAPRSALQRVGDLFVVFVRSQPGVYEPRVVSQLGGDDWVGIQGSVKAGESVVTTGAVLLKTEILPGSIGAGCCEVEPLESGGN